eukprot:358582-Chlamydomonas_euryale.AAC.10
MHKRHRLTIALHQLEHGVIKKVGCVARTRRQLQTDACASGSASGKRVRLLLTAGRSTLIFLCLSVEIKSFIWCNYMCKIPHTKLHAPPYPQRMAMSNKPQPIPPAVSKCRAESVGIPKEAAKLATIVVSVLETPTRPPNTPHHKA